MILADKIINERKKNGWSQEELAEQLSVSRQSVSKWEGAQSIPDIQKIIQMSQIFGVSTDYLLKDDVEQTKTEMIVEDTSYSPLRKVSIEEANEFIESSRMNAPKVAIGTSLCILCPAVLIFLAGLSSSDKGGISEGFAVGIGLIVLFACIACAVTLFILTGHKNEKFDFLKNESFETQYGVTGMVKELMESSQSSYTVSVIIGCILCLTSPLPIIIAALLNAPDYVVCSMVCVLLIIIAVAVSLFVISGSTRSCYKILLQEGDFTKSQKELSKKTNAWASAYWSVMVVIYLAWSFLTNSWGFTWIVWPIAGVAYGAFISIVKAIKA